MLLPELLLSLLTGFSRALFPLSLPHTVRPLSPSLSLLGLQVDEKLSARAKKFIAARKQEKAKALPSVCEWWCVGRIKLLRGLERAPQPHLHFFSLTSAPYSLLPRLTLSVLSCRCPHARCWAAEEPWGHLCLCSASAPSLCCLWASHPCWLGQRHRPLQWQDLLLQVCHWRDQLGAAHCMSGGEAGRGGDYFLVQT